LKDETRKKKSIIQKYLYKNEGENKKKTINLRENKSF